MKGPAVAAVAATLSACSLGLSADEFAGGKDTSDGGDAGASIADASGAETAADATSPIDAGDAGDDGNAGIPDLLAYWPFDEGQGTTTNDHGSGNHNGTLKNGALWAPGKIGNAAIDFDGADDCVFIGASPTLFTPSFTVTLWIEADTIPTSMDPRVFVEGARFDVKLNVGKPQLTIGAVYARSSYVIDAGTWHHIAFTFENGAATCYVDGTQTAMDADTLTPSTTLPTTGGNIGIGAYPDGTQAFDGRIDDVRLYTRALTAAEVLSLTK